ncbi:MAG TPA: hypothetical protein VFA94_04585 [Acidimicrobiales bacterium]|nr:hypothetical protein [Acidimicrobiales bacterium]
MRNRLAAVVAALVVLTGGSPVLARGGNRSLVPRPGGTRVDGRALARAAAEAGAPRFRIGFDKQLLDPDPADIAAKSIHLGGFGLFPTRASTGPMTLPDGSPEHLYVRAMAVINDRGKALLLANLENQGTFAAYKQCACGIWDARQQVALELGIPIESIVVNSDHSHGGPDLIGLWGGVPVHYLQYVHDQTVKALKAAFANAQPAYLLAGASTPTMPTPEDGGYVASTATPGEKLVHSQFEKDAATGVDENAVDTELRALHAVTPLGENLGTLINYSAHADVAGSSNLGYTADWPGWIATKTERALDEPVAVTMVADVGRSQPPRPNSDPTCVPNSHPGCEADKIDTYTRILLPFVTGAVGNATAVADDSIANSEIFTREPATNPALLGVSFTGATPANGYGAYRSATPPWVTGNVVGTFVSAHRVGDLLLTAAPGEAYPDIRFAVQKSVTGNSRTYTFGLANDQLGYLIAPTSEYPWISASNPGNDNAFFNVSVSYGDHVTCSQTTAAVATGFTATGEPMPFGPNANPPACPYYGAEDLVPQGPSPQAPWPWGDDNSTIPVPGS